MGLSCKCPAQRGYRDTPAQGVPIVRTPAVNQAVIGEGTEPVRASGPQRARRAVAVGMAMG